MNSEDAPLVPALKFNEVPETGLIVWGERAPNRELPAQVVAFEREGDALSVWEIVEGKTFAEAVGQIERLIEAKRPWSIGACYVPVEEGRAIRYLAPDAITLSEAVEAGVGTKLRAPEPEPPRVIGTGETSFTVDDANELREEVIQLRDAALKEGHMAWAVSLSHVVAFMAVARQEIWGE